MLKTQLDPRQAMVACLDQWRASIVEHDDAGLLGRVRDIESVSRMLHSVMLDAVAELESRTIAATAGFGTTQRLLAGMLHLSATDARTRVTHATQLARRRTLSGEVLTPVLPHTAAALAAGEIGPAQVRVIAEPSTLDMLTKLRHQIIAARFLPSTPRPATTQEILEVQQAWALAAA